jgi:pimeloyl-ACP methyl ester carboxylesterase
VDQGQRAAGSVTLAERCSTDVGGAHRLYVHVLPSANPARRSGRSARHLAGNELSRHPKRFDEAKRQHYAALYAQAGAMRASFAQFLAFTQDAADNSAILAQGKLRMPVLAPGGEATFGSMIGSVIRSAAEHVEDVIIPDCGHWITEEQPQATTDLVVGFLHRRS